MSLVAFQAVNYLLYIPSGVQAMDSAPRRGNELLAQGIALGKQRTYIVRPVGAKASLETSNGNTGPI